MPNVFAAIAQVSIVTVDLTERIFRQLPIATEFHRGDLEKITLLGKVSHEVASEYRYLANYHGVTIRVDSEVALRSIALTGPMSMTEAKKAYSALPTIIIQH